MLPKLQLEAWKTYYDSARHNDILNERTTVMIHLAAAMSQPQICAAEGRLLNDPATGGSCEVDLPPDSLSGSLAAGTGEGLTQGFEPMGD